MSVRSAAATAEDLHPVGFVELTMASAHWSMIVHRNGLLALFQLAVLSG